MRFPFATLATLLILLAAGARAVAAADARSGFILAGEPVAFDEALRPRFTARQRGMVTSETLAGFDRWARTREGRWIIRRLREGARTVVVLEDRAQEAIGRAPQPGLRTMLAATDPKARTDYVIILNPALAAQYRGEPDAPLLGRPRTPADAMALTWAAEMLHVDFYADGIVLPHHERADFQERWQGVAAQLGFANTPHGRDD